VAERRESAGRTAEICSEEDLSILRGLWLGRSHAAYTGGFALQGATGAAILEKLIATGRAFTSFVPAGAHYPGSHCPVHCGSERGAKMTWQAQPDTRVRPVLQAEPPATLLLTTTALLVCGRAFWRSWHTRHAVAGGTGHGFPVDAGHHAGRGGARWQCVA
jgi:hypothetical protein